MRKAAFVLFTQFGVWAWSSPVAAADQVETPSAPKLRRPVALALLRSTRLGVGNRRSGSIALVDTEALCVVTELSCCELLADLAAFPDSPHFLAVDEASHELILIAAEGDELRVISEQRVAPYPVSVRVSADGKKCCVASLWSRSLTAFDLAVSPDGGEVGFGTPVRLPLPFAPRQQLFLDAWSKLVVADSFGGSLALIDTLGWRVESVREIPGHNIRGLALTRDGQRLLVAHQLLNPLARTELADVHWGSLMTNNVRALAMKTLLDSRRDLLEGGRLEHLGDAGRGAGDPGAIAVDSQDRVIVTLSGVGEVAVKGPGGSAFDRLTVGRRPTAALQDPETRRVFIANTFSDSISILSFGEAPRISEMALGTYADPAPADRGELLFFDARLSHDGWLSCHSCHTDGHSNGLLGDTLGDGSFGAPKRVLSLLGVADTGPWAWNGQVGELEAQVRKSVETTMQGTSLSESDAADLTAYLRTLPPPPPLPRNDDHDASISRGRALFAERGCRDCHPPPAYTSGGVYDVGLADELGVKRFNPPSLRGSGHRSAHFHDNRAESLEAVLSDVAHQLETRLSPEDLTDLVRFLESL